LAIYDQKNGYESVDKMVEELGFTAYINQTAAEYLKQQGINENFVHEVLQTAARGNYCQDLNILHVFAVMVSFLYSII
jgi:prenylcysteine oxidase/farnesylcysteine lyase